MNVFHDKAVHEFGSLRVLRFSNTEQMVSRHLMVSTISVSSAASALRSQAHTHTHRGVSIPWELKQLNEDIASAVWLILLREEQQRDKLC